MRYISTRGSAPALTFDDVLLAGLARDGGLYVPETWPKFDADAIRELRGLSYAELAVRVMTPFLGQSISPRVFSTMVDDAYAGFDHAAVAPLVQLETNDWLMELFHGPTLAFKDYALQLVGRLFDHVLAARAERITIVGATSGDTGSAAIEACRDREAIDIFILHPKGRVTEVQRRQMTSVASPNVFNIAIEGSFDDCQDLVKAMFADEGFRNRVNLSAVNSINWARVMAQIVYYTFASVALGAPERKVSFAVPSGNFGNVFAAYAARSMGFPIVRLVVGANENDILDRFFQTGAMETRDVLPTLSPSMDIQVSSNLERLLFDLFDRDGPALAEQIATFRRTGSFEISDNQLGEARSLFDSYRLNDDETVGEIARVHLDTGQTVDPHTAIGIAAGRARRGNPSVPMVALATAHPAKFAEAVERGTGERPALPARLADLYDRPERCTDLPNDLAIVQDFVAGHARRAQEVA
ncbi:MAG: threonine synthase [Pseudomonadota bacterium]